MKTLAICAAAAVILVLGGCGSPSPDSRVNLAQGVGSDTPGSSIITRPIGQAFSALIGEGLEIYETTVRTNPQGFKEVQVRGYNKAHQIRRFDYRVEWLDADGMEIPSKTKVWQAMSVQPKSGFTIRSVAPRTDAVDFRLNTRRQPQ